MTKTGPGIEDVPLLFAIADAREFAAWAKNHPLLGVANVQANLASRVIGSLISKEIGDPKSELPNFVSIALNTGGGRVWRNGEKTPTGAGAIAMPAEPKNSRLFISPRR